MNETAFTELVGVIDEAIGLADCAVKAAEAASSRTLEPVTLVKVATSRYRNTAEELIKTGTFRGHTATSLAQTLENAGPAEFLDLMEKLASRAVFPLDAEAALGGDLVEKSGKNRSDAAPRDESRTDLWVRCCEDAGLNVHG
jgi:hypothetical protein